MKNMQSQQITTKNHFIPWSSNPLENVASKTPACNKNHVKRHAFLTAISSGQHSTINDGNLMCAHDAAH